MKWQRVSPRDRSTVTVVPKPYNTLLVSLTLHFIAAHQMSTSIFPFSQPANLTNFLSSQLCMSHFPSCDLPPPFLIALHMCATYLFCVWCLFPSTIGQILQVVWVVDDLVSKLAVGREFLGHIGQHRCVSECQAVVVVWCIWTIFIYR